MAISFQSQNVRFNLGEKQKVKTWIRQIIGLEKKQCGEINFVFTSDEELLKTNIAFLNHNTFTDIITFDSCEGDKISGDIIISIDRVKDNAIQFNAAFEDELHRVIIHGILHLCGYKDKTAADEVLMRKKENWALKKFPAG